MTVPFACLAVKKELCLVVIWMDCQVRTATGSSPGLKGSPFNLTNCEQSFWIQVVIEIFKLASLFFFFSWIKWFPAYIQCSCTLLVVTQVFQLLPKPRSMQCNGPQICLIESKYHWNARMRASFKTWHWDSVVFEIYQLDVVHRTIHCMEINRKNQLQHDQDLVSFSSTKTMSPSLLFRTRSHKRQAACHRSTNPLCLHVCLLSTNGTRRILQSVTSSKTQATFA